MAEKCAGRPKVNREIKKRASFTILPSLYEQVKLISEKRGESVSELIDQFFKEYIEKNKKDNLH